MNIYTLRDSKVKAYLAPFNAQNDNVAKRMLADSATGDSVIFKHPEDFQIFRIGEYDEQTGEIKPTKHKSLGKVIDLLGSPDEN